MRLRRRTFIAGLGAAAAWPLAARAQQAKALRRLGVLMSLSDSDPDAQTALEALQGRLRELGWANGKNLNIDYRWAEGDTRALSSLARELVVREPDVLFVTGTPAAKAMQRQASDIPIVFVQVADPVGAGLVTTFAHPGGNVTGFTNYESSIGGKWIGMLREIAPSTTRTLVLFNPDNPGDAGLLATVQAAAQSLGVQTIGAQVRDALDIEHSFDAFAPRQNDGLIALNDLVTTVHRALIIERAAHHRLPAIYPFKSFATSGGLLSYGIDDVDVYLRAASYVERILAGEKVATLPVQAPTKFQMVINLKTARALGLSVPPTLLATADEVIE